MRDARTRVDSDMDQVSCVLMRAFRERCWESPAFRTENGISEVFALLELLGTSQRDRPSADDVYSMCREIVTTQRIYVVHNTWVQVCLCRMAIAVGLPRRDTERFRATLRGTLEDTMVPFCLFLHNNCCERSVDVIRRVLVDTIFRDRPDVPRQWPDWDTNGSPTPSTKGNDENDKTCPITLDSIVDGVIASDGHLYERAALLKYMVEKQESPITREWLDVEFVPWTESSV